MPRALRMLIVEDVPQDAEVAVAELRRTGIAVESLRVETESDFEAALDVDAPDLILEEEAARHAVTGERHGFLQKPFDVAMLAAAIRSALDGGGGA